MGKQPVLSAEREAQLLALFPHHSDAELATRFGLTVRQAHHVGAKRGLHKTAATRSASRRQRCANGPALSVRVEQLVRDQGAAGLTRGGVEALLPDVSASSIASVLNKLTANGHIHRAGGKGKSRWFIDRVDAESFLAAQRASAPKPGIALPASVRIAPPAGPAEQPGPPHIPEGIEIQRGKPVPGPEGRWHTNAARVFRGRIGQYDDPAPRPWVAAITTPSGQA